MEVLSSCSVMEVQV